MNLWTVHFAVSKETAQRQVSSRRFVRESITRSPALNARRSQKQLANANITDIK